MDLYEIVFTGAMVPGAEPDAVKANLARLFQADAQRIAQLFSGRRIVIKTNLDAAAAEKYRSTIERAGAVVEVVGLQPEMEEVEMAPPPAEAPAPARQPGRLKVRPRDEYMAAFSEVDAPDFDIAEIGTDLADKQPPAQAPNVDLSQFSLAPAGADMGQEKTAPAAPPPDTSHLRLV